MSVSEELSKVAKEVREDGISVPSTDGLLKKASDIRIAYLITQIKKS